MKKNLLFLLPLLLCFVFSSRSQVTDNEKKLALGLVQTNSPVTGLTPDDLNNSIVANTYVIPGSNIRMVYLQQSYQGIPVYNQMQVLAFKDDKLVSNAGGRLKTLNELSRNANSVPAVSSINAVQTSFNALKIKRSQEMVALKSLDNGKKVDFGKQQISLENITAELIWLPIEESTELKLVWQVFVAPRNDEDYWLVRVDAKSNTVINKQSLTIKCNWDKEEHSLKNHVDKKHPVKNNVDNITPIEFYDVSKTLSGPSVVNTASYRVVKYPAESPTHPGGANVLVTDPWLMSPGNATSLGWHNDATTSYSTTRGNNVYAYEDRNADNLPGISEVSTTAQPSLTFDFVPNLSLEPTVRTPAPNQQFNTTNLFYWNNLLHDLSYIYGFTESARNFQNNNQGRGGAGGDYVLAESQDGSGTNNANFSTPSDGGRGRMQMYLWTSPTPDRDGDVDNGIVAHEYTHGISNRLTGNGVTCLNNLEQMGEGWSDYFGLMITHDWANALAGDGFSKPRGIGTYVLNQPVTGLGIRQYRYTSNMAVNPLTYGNLATVAVPHGVGTIWCTALWDMTWEIIQTQGINANIYNIAGGGGNAIALKLVFEGMRLQPCSPGFIDGRNAILKADTLFFGAQYSCAIIKAFARRGMGIGALQGSSNSRTDQTLSFVDCSSATCNAPTGLTTTSITNSSATVNWTAVSGAVSYTVEYKLNSASTWTSATAATTATSVNITGLTASALYDWRVRTNCSGGNSSYTQAQFTTTAAPCNAPTGLTATAITATGATVNWTTVAGSVSYTVEYKINSASTWATVAVATTATSVNITGLNASTLYDWRVRTNCTGGNSTYTQAQFTTTATATCNAPIGLTTTAITVTSATVNWTAATGANDYTVEYKLNSASTWTTAAAATTATSVNITGLTASSLYDWRVRTNCTGGNSGYTQAQFTTAAAPCNAPTGLAATAITATGATVNWTAVTGAVSYTVEYKLNTASTWSTAAAATTATSVNLTGLTASSLYDWRVRTNCTGNNSIYTQAQFTTAAAGSCNAPAGLTTTAISATSATINWTAVAGAINYAIAYKLKTASTWNTSDVLVTTLSANITGLKASTLYDWRVQANCSGGSSAYTQAQFTTTGTTICNAPAVLTTTAITATSATVNWTVVTSANDYTVEYKLNTASTWTTAATATTGTSVNITGLTASTLYDWRVRTNCTGGSSVYAQAQFTTAAALCNAPTGLTATAITATSATVNWTAVTGANDYTVEYKLNGVTTWTTASAATNATSVNITGLAASTLYDWRVRTNCTGGNSVYTQAQFTTVATPCNVPMGLTATAITATSATVDWTVVTGANDYTVEYKLNTASTWTTAAAATTATSVNITGLAASILYDWRVRANCTGGSSGYTQAQFTTAAAPCNAPTSLTATVITATSATVNWAVVTGANDYTVEYKLNSVSTWTTAATATTATSVNIMGLAAFTLYDCRVRANCTGGNSAYTLAQFTTIVSGSCNAPTGLTATAITASGVTINWSAVPGAINYTVGFKLRAASTWNTSDAPITNLSIDISGLKASTLYDWRVRANCSGGSSVYSQSAFTTASTATFGEESATDVITKINVFPNPAHQSVTVSVGELKKGTAELLLFDIYGKLLLKQRTSQSYTTVDISSLAAGTYIIRIKNEKSECNVKIVKQK